MDEKKGKKIGGRGGVGRGGPGGEKKKKKRRLKKKKPNSAFGGGRQKERGKKNPRGTVKGKKKIEETAPCGTPLLMRIEKEKEEENGEGLPQCCK